MGDTVNNSDWSEGDSTDGFVLGLPQHDEADRASDLIASIMTSGLVGGSEELIPRLRASDPQFRRLDEQFRRSLRNIHDVGEGPGIDSSLRPNLGRTQRNSSRSGSDSNLAAIQWTLNGVTTLLLEASIEALSLRTIEVANGTPGDSPDIDRLIIPLTPCVDRSDETQHVEDIFDSATSAGPKIVIDGFSRTKGLSGCSVTLTNEIATGRDEFTGSGIQRRVVILGEGPTGISQKSVSNRPQGIVVGYLTPSENDSLFPDCLKISRTSSQPLDDLLELIWTMCAFVNAVARQAPQDMWNRQVSPSLVGDGMRVLKHVLTIFAGALSKLPQESHATRQFVSWLFLKSGQGNGLEVKVGSERYPQLAQHFVSLDPQNKRQMGLCGRAYVFQETRVSRNAKHDPRCLNALEEDVDQAVAIPLSEVLQTAWLSDSAKFCPGVVYLGVRRGSFTKAEILFARLYSKVITRLLIEHTLMQNWRRGVRDDLDNLPLVGWYVDSDSQAKKLIQWLISVGSKDVSLIMYKVGRASEIATGVSDLVPRDVAWAGIISAASRLVSQHMSNIKTPQTGQMTLPSPDFQPPELASVYLYQKDPIAGIAGLSQGQALGIAERVRRALRTNLSIHKHLNCVRIEVLVLWLSSDILNQVTHSGHLESGQLPIELLINDKLSILKMKADEWLEDVPPILVLDCATDQITVVEDGDTHST